MLRELASLSGDLDAEFEDQAESMELLFEMNRLAMQHGLGVLTESLREYLGIGGTPSATALEALVRDPRYAYLVAGRGSAEGARLELYERLSGAMDRLLGSLETELARRGAAYHH